MQERHAIAATFRDKVEAEQAVLALASQGVRDQNIRVLLPPGEHAGQFKRETGVESRTVGGEGILDRLAELFHGGATQLSDFGLSDQERQRLEDYAKKGEYVVAVRCDGMCPNIHATLARYGASESFGVEPETREGQQRRSEYSHRTSESEQRGSDYPFRTGEGQQPRTDYPFRTGEGERPRSDHPSRTGESDQRRSDYPFHGSGASDEYTEERH